MHLKGHQCLRCQSLGDSLFKLAHVEAEYRSPWLAIVANAKHQITATRVEEGAYLLPYRERLYRSLDFKGLTLAQRQHFPQVRTFHFLALRD